MPSDRSAVATSSCVDSGFEEQSATSAPPAASRRASTPVSAVSGRQAAMRTPASGRSAANRSRTRASTGMARSECAMRRAPADAGTAGAAPVDGGSVIQVFVSSEVGCRRSVAVVVGLVRALDVDADVLRLLLAELGQLDAEGVEVQARDLLVEVLRQDVDLLVVLAGLRPELDLRDDLVRERVRHDEA